MIERMFAAQDAVTVTEYAIMLALIVLVAVAAISGIGLTVENTFTTLDTEVTGAMGS
jgi:Flp pilus assembly pilin Flp